MDGSVSGSYSYTDPDGKLVQIDYTAGPRGYQAVGENVPPQPVLQLPQPVQDTLEVQMARQEFLDTYNRELERIQRDQEAAAAQAATASSVAPDDVQASSTPSSSEVTEESSTGSAVSDSETDTSNDDAVVVSGKTEPGDDESNPAPVPVPQQDGEGVIQDDEADSVVVSAKENSGEEENKDQNPVRSSLPDPSYSITIPIGVGGNAGVSVQGSLVGARGQEEQQQQGQQMMQNMGVQTNNLQRKSASFQSFFNIIGSPIQRLCFIYFQHTFTTFPSVDNLTMLPPALNQATTPPTPPP